VLPDLTEPELALYFWQVVQDVLWHRVVGRILRAGREYQGVRQCLAEGGRAREERGVPLPLRKGRETQVRWKYLAPIVLRAF